VSTSEMLNTINNWLKERKLELSEKAPAKEREENFTKFHSELQDYVSFVFESPRNKLDNLLDSYDLLKTVLQKADEVLKYLKDSLLNSKLICYKGYGGDEDIFECPRYQLALVTYPNDHNTELKDAIYSEALKAYVKQMHLFLSCPEVNNEASGFYPTAARFFEQIILRNVAENFLGEIFKTDALMPLPSIFKDKRELTEKEKQNNIQTDDDFSEGDWSKDYNGNPRIKGVYLDGSELKNDEKKIIKDSLTSGHSNIFIDSFSNKVSEGIRCLVFSTGWLYDIKDNTAKSKTSNSVMDRHETKDDRFIDNFKGWYQECHPDDSPSPSPPSSFSF